MAHAQGPSSRLRTPKIGGNPREPVGDWFGIRQTGSLSATVASDFGHTEDSAVDFRREVIGRFDFMSRSLLNRQ
jgi:hypothetical protein